ncbi:MAG: hypothetical protein ACTSRG_21740 [Candidatus Helarchaeota archaeon]
MTKEMKTMNCPYCKIRTAITPVKTEVVINRTKYFSHITYKEKADIIWWLGLCNYCMQPVLVRQHHSFLDIFPRPLPPKSDENIPEYIRKDLDEAKLCF